MSDIIVRVIDAYVFTRKNNQIRFLILKRAKTKMYEHLWQGVAGKIEEGEKSWEAAIRELEEETGFVPLRIFVADHVSRFYEAQGDRINLIPNGNSKVNTIEFLGANVKINVTYGKNGNLTVSQSDVSFAKSKIKVGDNVKVSWNKKNQLELKH